MRGRRDGPNLQPTKTVRSDAMTAARIRKKVSEFWSEENGAVAIEYALLAVLIAGTIATAVSTFGSELKRVYDEVAQLIVAALT